jgi:hypothetical protein
VRVGAGGGVGGEVGGEGVLWGCGEEADGLGEGRLEGPAVGGVFGAVAGEDLALGEEGGEGSVVGGEGG